MYEKHYVLQIRKYPWDDKHWVTIDHPFKTYEDAAAARFARPFPKDYRVAESYVVIRYKPVKK